MDKLSNQSIKCAQDFCQNFCYKEKHAGETHQALYCLKHLPNASKCRHNMIYAGESYVCGIVFAQDLQYKIPVLDDTTRLFLEDFYEYSELRPCPKCATIIAQPEGCLRVNCPKCLFSFWFPSGECWSKFSERMRTKYQNEPNYRWWTQSEDEDWVRYWEPWL